MEIESTAKPTASGWTRCRIFGMCSASFCALVGIGLVMTGVLMRGIYDRTLEKTLKENVVVDFDAWGKEGQETWEVVDKKYNMYVWNLTNPKDVLTEGAKPELEEVHFEFIYREDRSLWEFKDGGNVIGHWSSFDYIPAKNCGRSHCDTKLKDEEADKFFDNHILYAVNPLYVAVAIGGGGEDSIYPVQAGMVVNTLAQTYLTDSDVGCGSQVGCAFRAINTGNYIQSVFGYILSVDNTFTEQTGVAFWAQLTGTPPINQVYTNPYLVGFELGYQSLTGGVYDAPVAVDITPQEAGIFWAEDGCDLGIMGLYCNIVSQGGLNFYVAWLTGSVSDAMVQGMIAGNPTLNVRYETVVLVKNWLMALWNRQNNEYWFNIMAHPNLNDLKTTESLDQLTPDWEIMGAIQYGSSGVMELAGLSSVNDLLPETTNMDPELKNYAIASGAKDNLFAPTTDFQLRGVEAKAFLENFQSACNVYIFSQGAEAFAANFDLAGVIGGTVTPGDAETAGMTAATQAMDTLKAQFQGATDNNIPLPCGAYNGFDYASTGCCSSSASFQFFGDYLQAVAWDYVMMNGENSALKMSHGESGLNSGLPNSNTGIIMKQTLREFMFGWEDAIFDFLPVEMHPASTYYPGFYGPDDKFNTPKEVRDAGLPNYYEVYTGQDNIRKAGMTKSWKGVESVAKFSDLYESVPGAWDNPQAKKSCPEVDYSTTECGIWNKVEQIEGGRFLQQDILTEGEEPIEEISLWVSQAMRNIPFNPTSKKKEITFKGLKMWEYRPADYIMNWEDERNEPYLFYSPDHEQSAITGNPWDTEQTDVNHIIPMTQYYQGVPFYVGDVRGGHVAEEVKDHFDGIGEFDTDKHQTWFALEPISGRVMAGYKRFQYTMKLERSKFSSPAWDGVFQCTPNAKPGLPGTDCKDAISGR